MKMAITSNPSWELNVEPLMGAYGWELISRKMCLGEVLFVVCGFPIQIVQCLSVLYRLRTLFTLYHSPSVCQSHSEFANIF